MPKILAVLNRVDTAASVLAVTELLAERLGKARAWVMHPRLPQDPDFMPTEEVMTPKRQHAFDVRTSERAEALRDIFYDWQQQSGSMAGVQWLEIVGQPSTSVRVEGSRADLVVLGHPLASDERHVHAAFNAALYDASAAVVSTPLKPPVRAATRPAIAWAPSHALDKAIASAWPLLVKSGRVCVMSARAHPSAAGKKPDALLAALTRAGVTSDVVEFDHKGKHVGDALLSHVTALQADLLVMGAFTHNPLVEWLRSSTTMELLQHSGIPLLMHH